MMHPDRIDNFGGGPAALPLPVLQAVQAELLNFAGSGMSALEISHRSPAYEDLQAQAEDDLRELLGISPDYAILFLQGGASLQFAMLPFNFLGASSIAAYALTGSWSEKALAEAQKLGATRVVADGRPQQYRRIPDLATTAIEPDDAYFHLTSNNTIFGSQWRTFPDTGDVPLVADMSSDILSRAIPVDRFGLIYAGAQKNLGPSGVTVVIVRRSWLDAAKQIADAKQLPTILRYDTHVKNNSMYNTPPVFAVWVVAKVLNWLKQTGGVAAAERLGQAKAERIYSVIDDSRGFYSGYVDAGSRSRTNVTFRLPTPELEQLFLVEAEENGLSGLAGHRSVGGCRASLYNAVSVDACDRLAEFMVSFRRVHS